MRPQNVSFALFWGEGVVMRWIAAVMMLVMPAAVAAQGQQQFDLVCKGQEQANASAPKKPVTRVYRIDLDRKVWCIEECSVVLPIFEVTDARLVLQRIERYGMEIDHWVDRTTGEARELYFDAECNPAPFTAIPQRRF